MLEEQVELAVQVVDVDEAPQVVRLCAAEQAMLPIRSDPLLQARCMLANPMAVTLDAGLQGYEAIQVGLGTADEFIRGLFAPLKERLRDSVQAGLLVSVVIKVHARMFVVLLDDHF